MIRIILCALLALSSVQAEAAGAGRLRAHVGGGGGSSLTGDVFVEDTFTGTNGQTLIGTPHIGETGATWSRNGAASAEFTIESNQVYATAAGGVHPSGTPADADYEVECVLNVRTLQNNGNFYICGGRFSTSVVSGYAIGFVGTSSGNGVGEWRLLRYTTGTSVALGTSVGVTLTQFSSYTLKIRMQGDQISGYLGGALIIGPVTDGNYTAAGSAIMRNSATVTSSTGVHFATFKAYN